MKLLRINDSWVLAICMTLTKPRINPSKATVINAEMLRNNRVRSFIASFIKSCSKVVLLAFAVQRRRIDAECAGRLVQRVAGRKYGADMSFFQLVQAQSR